MTSEIPAGAWDWEVAAANRLGRVIGSTVQRMRDTADQIEREAVRNIAAAAGGRSDYATYSRVAAQVISDLHSLLSHVNASNIIHAAREADAAHAEKGFVKVVKTEEKELQGKALRAVAESLDGWIEVAKENHEASGHSHENTGDECWRRFAPSDVRIMINEAARGLGVSMLAKTSAEEMGL